MPIFRRRAEPSGTPELHALPKGLYLMANKRTMIGIAPEEVRGGEFPKYVVHVKPDEPADSGWQVFVGDESQDDANDPDSFQINAVETLTNAFPALRQILAVGVTGAWEWDDDRNVYRRLADSP